MYSYLQQLQFDLDVFMSPFGLCMVQSPQHSLQFSEQLFLVVQQSSHFPAGPLPQIGQHFLQISFSIVVSLVRIKRYERYIVLFYFALVCTEVKNNLTRGEEFVQVFCLITAIKSEIYF